MKFDVLYKELGGMVNMGGSKREVDNGDNPATDVATEIPEVPEGSEGGNGGSESESESESEDEAESDFYKYW